MFGDKTTMRERILSNDRVLHALERTESMPVIGRLSERLAPPAPGWRLWLRRAWPYAATSGVTFGVAYFFDVDRGRGRRARTKDRVAGISRRIGRRTRRTGRHLASDAAGMRERMAHREPADPWPDDKTLAHKVESEIFGGRSFDKSRLLVNAENGVVVVRGEADTPRDIDRLERRVREIPGVVDVRMLVHTKNQPAHTTEPSIRASNEARNEMRRIAR